MFPELPTVAEAALPGYESVLHYGIVAPAGTPRPVIAKLNAAMREALKAPDTIERMATDGTESFPSTPEEYAADIDREEIKWSAVVKKSGAKAEEKDEKKAIEPLTAAVEKYKIGHYMWDVGNVHLILMKKK